MLSRFLAALAIMVFITSLAATAMAGNSNDSHKGLSHGQKEAPAVQIKDTLNGSLNDNSVKTKTDNSDNSDNSLKAKLDDIPIAVDNKDSAVAQDGSTATDRSHNDLSQHTSIKDSFKFFDERCQNCTNVTATMTQTTGGKISYNLSGQGGTATSTSKALAVGLGGDADAKAKGSYSGDADANGGASGKATSDSWAKARGGDADATAKGSDTDVHAKHKAKSDTDTTATSGNANAKAKSGQADSVSGETNGGTATSGPATGGTASGGDASGYAKAKAWDKAEANGYGGDVNLTNKAVIENSVYSNSGITNVANGSGFFNNVGNMNTVSISFNSGTIK